MQIKKQVSKFNVYDDNKGSQDVCKTNLNQISSLNYNSSENIIVPNEKILETPQKFDLNQNYNFSPGMQQLGLSELTLTQMSVKPVSVKNPENSQVDLFSKMTPIDLEKSDLESNLEKTNDEKKIHFDKPSSKETKQFETKNSTNIFPLMQKINQSEVHLLKTFKWSSISSEQLNQYIELINEFVTNQRFETEIKFDECLTETNISECCSVDGM